MSVNSIVEQFAIKLVSDLRKSLKDKNVTYGGGQESRLAASIKYKISYSKGLTMDISMNDYYKFVDQGRGPGPAWSQKKRGQGSNNESPFSSKILKWVKKDPKQEGMAKKFAQEKKMPFNKAAKTLAFLIYRKIRKEGYKGNYFFTNIINDGRQELLAKQIREEYGKEIKNNLDKWQSQ